MTRAPSDRPIRRRVGAFRTVALGQTGHQLDAPSAFTARTRYSYVCSDGALVSDALVTLGAVTATTVHAPLPMRRLTSKPVSPLLWSVHVRRTVRLSSASADISAGAASVVALAVP